MNGCRPKRSEADLPSTQTPPEILENKHDQVLLQIPGCKVHVLDEEGEVAKLGDGEFELIVRISDADDDNVSSPATTIKLVGDHDNLQWPLTKDEPVLKLGSFHYLFTILPMKDDKPLSYGVTFSEKNGGNNLELLDSFLKENSLFTSPSSSSTSRDINWKEFAPATDDYNSVLAKAIAGGPGKVVKGIFKCSNAYTNQKGGETNLTRAVEEKKLVAPDYQSCQTDKDDSPTASANKEKERTALNKNLKRVRNMSRMTEKMSKATLDVVEAGNGSVIGPALHSKAGKAFLSTVPGEALLASLEALDKTMDAAEAAQKQTLRATSGAVTRMVTQRIGEEAGEATEDVLATGGHCAGTALNVFKIQKTINPASSVSSGLVIKNIATKKWTYTIHLEN